MPFHVSASDWRIQKLFANRPDDLLRSRTPIARRAQQVAKQRIACFAAFRLMLDRQDRNFTLGNNHFTLFNKAHDPDGLAKTFAHVSSLFNGTHFGVWAKGHDSNATLIDLVILQYPCDYVEYPPNETVYPSALLELSVYFDHPRQEFSLTYIRTEPRGQGLGGQVLGAVYNLAQELGMSKIVYNVAYTRISAKRFYFRTDFGRPLNDSLTSWELPLR